MPLAMSRARSCSRFSDDKFCIDLIDSRSMLLLHPTTAARTLRQEDGWSRLKIDERYGVVLPQRFGHAT
jgi:hypothetical protein